MASAKTLTTVISLAGKVDGSLNKAIKSAGSNTAKGAKAMSKSMTSNMKTATSAMSKSLKGFAGTALKVFATIKSLTALKNFANECITAAKAQLEVETKLLAVLENVKSIQIRGPNAAVEAANKLKETASEIQNIGVIGDEVLIAGMQQLATFQLSDKEISVLSSGMADLLAQQKGLSASQTDAVSIANMIGKVMDGSTSALSKVGISFTEAQEAAIKNGDSIQRAAAIAEVLEMNVGGVNKALAETDQGKIQQATNVLGDMKEVIGMYLLPLLADLASKAMPYVEKGFESLTKILDKLSPIVSDVMGKAFEKFNQILPDILDIINQLYPVVSELFGVFVGVGEEILPILIAGFQEIVPSIQETAVALLPLTKEMANSVVPIFQRLIPLITQLAKGILPIVQRLVTKLAPVFMKLSDAIIPIVETLFSGLIPALDSLVDPFVELVSKLLPPILEIFSQLAPVVSALVSAVAPLVTVLSSALLPAIDIIIPPIMNLVNTLLPPLQSLFSGIVSVVQSLAPILSIVANLFAQDLSNSVDFLSSVIDSVLIVFDNLLVMFKSIIDFIVNVFTGNWKGAWENLSSIAASAFSGLTAAVRAPINAIARLWNNSIGKLSFTFPDWVPGLGSKTFSAPQIPEFATGGTLNKATLLIAGEAGPETIVPHNNKPRSRALLQEAARGVGMSSGSGGGNTYVYSPTIYASNATGVKQVLDDDYERFKVFHAQLESENGREVFA